MSLALGAEVVRALRAQLPIVAEQTMTALVAEVPDYAGAFDSEMFATIEQAVQMALAGFLRLAAQPQPGADAPAGSTLQASLEGAYALGRGEARSGRTIDALLSAYRVGARVAWRELSATAVDNGLSATTVAQFAELVFAYIDELSAASVAGHTDELATSGRVLEQYRDRLGQALLEGAADEVLLALAGRADWVPPATLTAVLVPSARARTALPLLDPGTLRVSGDAVGLDDATVVLLVPDVTSRAALLRVLTGLASVVGPTRPWVLVAGSFRRAVRARALPGPFVDTEENLPALVLGADAEALADLRVRALAPLAGLKPVAAARLAETLRAWLLHQGRREDVAAALFVHPQTVRYRMTQLRELYGEALSDPEVVLELTLALALPEAFPARTGQPRRHDLDDHCP